MRTLPEVVLVRTMAAVPEAGMNTYREVIGRGRGVLQMVNYGGFISPIPPDGDNFANFFETQFARDEFGKAIEIGLKRSPEAVNAALTTMVAMQMARPMELEMSPPPPERMADYLPKHLRQFIRETADMIRLLMIPKGGEFTNIEVPKMRERRRRLLREGANELIVVLGLNGVGKTTVLGFIRDFADFIGLKIEDVKFPQKHGPLANLITAALSGETLIDRRSLQLLMLADLFEWLSSQKSESLICLADRFPIFDGRVYSPEVTQLLSLAAGEGVNLPLSVLVIDRHPLSCLENLARRPGKRRIFELDPEQMAQQQIALWSLTGLPGIRMINTERSASENRAVFFSGNYGIDATIHSGVWGRALVRSGRFPDFLSAQRWVGDKSWKWYSLRAGQYNIYANV